MLTGRARLSVYLNILILIHLNPPIEVWRFNKENNLNLTI